MASLSRQLAQWIVDLRYEDLPPEVVDRIFSPFFTTNQTYSQIVDTESTNILYYMLRGEANPLMFHQGNTWRYDGAHTLFTDVMDAAVSKFNRLSNLPIASMVESQIGALLAARMAYNASGVRGVLTPGVSFTLTTTKTATIPITGTCATGCSAYGGQNVSFVTVPAGATVTVPVQ